MPERSGQRPPCDTPSFDEPLATITDAFGAAGSFDALLRDVARVSVPPQRLPRALAPGTVLARGRFSVLRPFGEGGMGVVYEAFDTERNARVALKTLNRLDPSGVTRLKQEFRSLADVRHPNLVRLRELFADGDLWFFTMDAVVGERFDHWVRPSGGDGHAALDVARLRRALPQLVAAIDAIHAAGKLHRDLKPSNVLVTHEGRVVVLDFGLVASADAGSEGLNSESARVLGTPAYMAPEQAAGEPASAASDYYALGVMLFEALTGRLPFSGSVEDILRDKRQCSAPAASSLVTVPQDLDTLCARLLSVDALRRPNAEALRLLLGVDAAPLQRSSIPSRDQREAQLGRENELRTLSDAYQDMRRATPTIVRLTGGSGLGKTALVESFLDSLRRDNHAPWVLRGRCHERENVPYKGLDSLVDDLARLLEELPAPVVAHLIPLDVDALAQLFPVLRRVPAIDKAPRRMMTHADDLRRRAFSALSELIAGMRNVQPLVLWIDDAQWTDADSAQLMRYLWSQPEPAPVFWLITHRADDSEHGLLPELFEGVRDNRAWTLWSLSLKPLDEATLTRLALQTLGQAPSAQAIAQRIAAEAVGNPGLVSEIAAGVLRQGVAPMPPTLEETIRLRTDRLASEPKRLLTAIAVAGQPLPQALAVKVVAASAPHESVDALVDARLLCVTPGDGGRWLDCLHERVRQCVLRDVTDAEARDVERALAEALTEHPLRDPGLLIRCWERLGEPTRAGELAAVGAERAASLLAFDRAARLFERALALGRFDRSRTHALHLGYAHALTRMGRTLEAAEVCLRSRETADAKDVARLTRRAGELCLQCGNVRRGRALLAEGLSPLDVGLPLGTVGAIVSAMASQARLGRSARPFVKREQSDGITRERLDALGSAAVAFSRTDPIRSADFIARWVIAAHAAGDRVGFVRARACQLSFAGLLRLPWSDVEVIAREAQRLADQTHEPDVHVWLHHGRGVYHLMQGQPWTGDYQVALDHLDRCAELIRHHPLAVAPFDASWIHYQRANALTMLGRLREANRIADEQIETVSLHQDLALLPAWALTASYVRSAVGDVVRAERELLRAQAAWQPDDLTFQDMMLPAAVMVLAAFRGQARRGWQTCQTMLRQLQATWYGRLLFGKLTAPLHAIWAGAAAVELPPGSERDALVREVATACRAAQGQELTLATNARASLACARGDRDGAVKELRTLLATPQLTPTWGVATRRRLGVMLGGEEGRELVRDADEFLRAAGVVDPEAFTAAVMPGMEIR